MRGTGIHKHIRVQGMLRPSRNSKSEKMMEVEQVVGERTED